MRFDVITLFPELVSAVTGCGITGRAADRGLLEVQTWNPRDYAADRHRTVDDRPYGGGPGMVMMAEPLGATIRAARAAGMPAKVLYMSPQGRRLDQQAMRTFSDCERIILLAGRYEGVDERLLQSEVDEEWSLGDFVISGGELAAMVLIDAVTRLLPGALGDETSATDDSFSEGLLEAPQYTRPEEVAGRRVPDVLLNGNHAEIRRWRLQQALGRTLERRPDLIDRVELNDEQSALLEAFDRQRKENG